MSRNCVLLHTSLESHDLQAGLSKSGFNGNRLSLWVLQVTSLTCKHAKFSVCFLIILFNSIQKKTYLNK